MAEQEQEQQKSEEPTPHKLRRAREKGMVARGTDLGFFAVLAALAGFLIAAADTFAGKLALMMRRSFAFGIAGSADPQQALVVVAASYWSVLQPVLLLAGTAVLLVTFLEIVQLRGMVFSTQPMKPDFSRINPAKGLKRIFSMRMLKEALKNVIKMAVYITVALLAIRWTVAAPGRSSSDALGLATAMHDAGMRLLLMFVLAALLFVAIDQIIVRREYLKQMRMSRRELTREFREREGEPRIKRRRKQLHAEFAKQTKGLGSLPGSDMLIVNPHHVAVALAYDSTHMAAPRVTAKARNHWALAMKREAYRRGIPVFEARPLARQLFDQCETGQLIHEGLFHAVAALYLKLPPSRMKNDHAGPSISQQ